MAYIKFIICWVSTLISIVYSFDRDYDIDYSTSCFYNSESGKYKDNCSTKEDDFTVNIKIKSDSLLFNEDVYLVDSTRETLNSEQDSLILFYTKHLQTNDPTVFAFTDKYLNIAQLGVFKIGFNFKEASYYSGSGFGINSNYLVTNYHVVDKMKKIVIKSNGDFTTSATLKYFDESLDLAILKVNDSIKSCKLNYKNQNIGTDILTFGYPKVSQLGISLKATKGIISSKFGFKDDVKSYQIDAASQEGNSGGPLKKKNEVVGIVVSTLKESQNVNYAIKSIFLKAMLYSLDIKPKGKSLPSNCTYLIIGTK